MRGLAENVPWKRFWIPRETAPALDWDGYLVDPESDYGKVANAHARTLEQLEETPCVALLGEPGIGKSRVVDAYRESVRTSSGEVLAVDFRWHHDLDQKLFATRAFTRWREDGSPLTLLLDSLDEHPQRAEKVAQQLVGELHGGPVHALRLRVACRTAEWPPVLDEQLAQLWKKTNEGPSRVAFYALAPLRRVDVELAAGEVAAAFFDEVARVGAEPQNMKSRARLARVLRKPAKKKLLPVERRIRECLDYFKEGDENAGWKIHQSLRFDPEGKAHRSQFEWDLTKLPGWQHAEDEIKESILAVGRAYLLRADEHIDQWLGQNLLHLPAAAGYRYLCLIDKLDPGWLKSHSDYV